MRTAVQKRRVVSVSFNPSEWAELQQMLASTDVSVLKNSPSTFIKHKLFDQKKGKDGN